MFRILAYEVIKNKKFVLSYVIACVFLAVTGGNFLYGNGAVVYAAEVPAGETIAQIAMQVVGTSVASFAGSYASLVGVSCEPFAALLFIAVNVSYPFQFEPLFLAMYFMPIYIGTKKQGLLCEKDNSYISIH